MNSINIALATDHNYLNQTLLVIDSILRNGSDDNKYCIYVLADNLSAEEAMGFYYKHFCRKMVESMQKDGLVFRFFS